MPVMHRPWLRTLGGQQVSLGELRRVVLPRLRAVRRGQLALGADDRPSGSQPVRPFSRDLSQAEVAKVQYHYEPKLPH